MRAMRAIRAASARPKRGFIPGGGGDGGSGGDGVLVFVCTMFVRFLGGYGPYWGIAGVLPLCFSLIFTSSSFFT